jgi:hypothetical protein
MRRVATRRPPGCASIAPTCRCAPRSGAARAGWTASSGVDSASAWFLGKAAIGDSGKAVVDASKTQPNAPAIAIALRDRTPLPQSPTYV